MFKGLFSRLAGSLLEEVLEDEEILKAIRQFGGKLAYRFVGYHEVTIHLANGEPLKVYSPYFVKAKPKRGTKKRGPNGRGCHLLLDLLGFMCCSLFVSHKVAHSEDTRIIIKLEKISRGFSEKWHEKIKQTKQH